MTVKDDGGPAFPRPASQDGTGPRADCYLQQDGMTLRDWFAGQALAGMLGADTSDVPPASVLARHAFLYADALLAARKQPTT